jgi:hypothetical protein
MLISLVYKNFQFFNTSRTNVLATRRACLSIDGPDSGAGLVIQIEYLRTDTRGPLFERLRAKLAGIASQTGMDKVFHLRGADIPGAAASASSHSGR